MAINRGYLLGAVAGVGLAGAAAAGVGLTLPHAEAQTGAPPNDPRPPIGAPSRFAAGPGAPQTFADIFERVAPAVVSIEVTARVPRSELGDAQGLPFPFNQLPQFRQGPNGRSAPGQRGRRPAPNGGNGTADGDGDDSDLPEAQAAGSGFFISRDGYIVTNNHVVENATKITVTLTDKRELTARLIGRDEESDLAVLKVEGGNFPFVGFETLAKPRVGDWVLAVGNPLQLGGTATAGIVSAIGRDLPPDSQGNLPSQYLQIDAPINRGNSGGPTFDVFGRVIGVNSAIYSSTGGSIGIGFAIPADTADTITKELIAGRKITRGYLGAAITNIGTEQAESLGLPLNAGALIAEVTAGGPGARAGLQPGDIVLSVNGTKISGSNELTRAVAATHSGEVMHLEIRRNGRVQTVNVTSGVRPSIASLNKSGGAGGSDEESGPGNAGRSGANRSTILGMAVEPLTAAGRTANGLGPDVKGLLIGDVVEGSDAGKKGLSRGLVIVQANERSVSTPQEFAAAVADARKAGRPSIFLLINVKGQNRGVAIKLDEPKPSAR